MGECILQTGGGIGFPAGWNEKAEGIAWDDIQKNDPIVLREYGKIEGGLAEVFHSGVDPLDISCCRFSPDTKFLAVGLRADPFLVIFKVDKNKFTRLPNLDVMPAACVNFIVFSPDGSCLLTGNTPPVYLFAYKIVGDTFVSSPQMISTHPTDNCHDACFTSDSVYLAIVQGGTPAMRLYKKSGDTYKQIANPAKMPPASCTGCDFSPDGKLLIVNYGNEQLPPNSYIRSGDIFTWYDSGLINEGGGSQCIRFDPSGEILAIGHSNLPFVALFKRNLSNQMFTKLPNPDVLPDNTCYDLVFSHDGKYLAAGFASNKANFIIYKRDGHTFKKISFPIPEKGVCHSVDFSKTDKYLTAGCSKVPNLTVYLNEQDTYVFPLNRFSNANPYYYPNGKIGIATESKPRDSPVKATLFPALYNLTENGQGVT